MEAESHITLKLNKKLHSFDFILTMIGPFSGGVENYKALFERLGPTIEQLLNENLQLRFGDNEAVPLRFIVESVGDRKEVNALIASGVPVVSKKVLERAGFVEDQRKEKHDDDEKVLEFKQ